MRIEGQLSIKPTGDNRCRLVEQGQVSVRIPLVGTVAERKIVSIIEAHRRRRTAVLTALAHGCLPKTAEENTG